MTKVTGVIRARALPSATQHARRYSLSDPQLRGMAGMSGRFFRCLGFFTFTLQIATKRGADERTRTAVLFSLRVGFGFLYLSRKVIRYSETGSQRIVVFRPITPELV